MMTDAEELSKKIEQLGFKVLKSVNDNDQDKYYEYMEKTLELLPTENFKHLNFMIVKLVFEQAKQMDH